jgi:hypothetical protein
MLTQTATVVPLTAAAIVAQVFREGQSSGSRATIDNCRIHIISQGSDPRWIIVGEPRKALPVLSSWAPWKISSRVRWNAVRMAAAMNLLPSMPGVQSSMMQIDTSYWRANLPCFPKQWSAVIHVGNASHSRKAILFLIENGERVVSASKIPLVAGAVGAIFNEADMLDLLSRFDYLPRVLFRDRERGIATQSWLVGKPVSRGFSEPHLNLLRSLVRADGTARVSGCREELSASLAASDLPFDRSVLARGLELLDYDSPLRCFVEHRDFAPWNLKWLRRDVLGLLDWEWAIAEGLPWQDACRHFYIDDVHFGGSGQVWEALLSNEVLFHYRREFEIPTEALPALTMRYLLRELLMEWEGQNEWLAKYAFRQIQSLLKSVSSLKV